MSEYSFRVITNWDFIYFFTGRHSIDYRQHLDNSERFVFLGISRRTKGDKRFNFYFGPVIFQRY